jgi:uncharacterized protein YprB with RNaseH-like and TPR domain
LVPVIEASGLFSTTNTIICIGIFDPENFKEPFIYFVHRPEEEIKALEWLKNQITKFGYNTICGWNSKKYDLPFLAGRALTLNFDFPELQTLLHIDLMEVVKEKFKLHSYRLEDVCKWLKIPYENNTKGWMIDSIYHKSLVGDKQSENQIKEHCKNDLIILSKLFQKLKPYLSL